MSKDFAEAYRGEPDKLAAVMRPGLGSCIGDLFLYEDDGVAVLGDFTIMRDQPEWFGQYDVTVTMGRRW